MTVNEVTCVVAPRHHAIRASHHRMDAFTAAIKSRDAESIASAFAGVASLTPPPDARALALGCNVCSHHRKNEVAHELYALGKRAHGVAAMRAGGLFLNQLLYACCREASMLDKALEVWADLQAAGEAVEAEPVGKLILACLRVSSTTRSAPSPRRRRQAAGGAGCARTRPRVRRRAAAAVVLCRLPSMEAPGWRCRRRRRSASSARSQDRHRRAGAGRLRACKGDATANDAAKVAQKIAEANKAAAATAAPPTPKRRSPRTRAALEKNHGEADRALAALAALEKPAVSRRRPPRSQRSAWRAAAHASRRARSSSSAASAATSTRSRKTCSTPSPSPLVMPSTPPPPAAPRRRRWRRKMRTPSQIVC